MTGSHSNLVYVRKVKGHIYLHIYPKGHLCKLVINGTFQAKLASTGPCT